MTKQPVAVDGMDSLFQQLRDSMFGETPAGTQTPVRMAETETGYTVTADLPGFETDDLDVRFDDGLLTISGDQSGDTGDEQQASHHHRRVTKQVRIPGSVRVEDIEAAYRNGVLEISLPVETDDSQQIQIE